MTSPNQAENHRRFVEAKKQQGLKRVILWARPEDIPMLKDIARQPHAIAAMRDKVAGEIEAELRPVLEKKIARQMEVRTRRAMLVQKRAQVRRQQAGSNRPPDGVRFQLKPPGAVRQRIKQAGWLYDPVAAVWHLPEDPSHWDNAEALMAELDVIYGVERLVLDIGAGEDTR
ncbi:hypothetical protein [Pontivivens insulae]|uniref:Uncharacterized protein n=1 Tax=Pontivivens insulae TaxID=1639689 RepID=A0A2R8AFV9_9RHOB|nr:hypothetical protein [Pontivivens insulae]RED10687.1 hypothetical protein DFR53_3506 [Pontivivens insulae]SPF31099.1 hypothetical protein POI8812_03450 [Pontivivens insulae]